MAATLKVEDGTKQALDRLQASLTLWIGRKPPLQELVERLVRMGWTHRDELASDMAGWRPATEAEVQQMVARFRALDHTVGTSPPMNRDDEDLYGEGT